MSVEQHSHDEYALREHPHDDHECEPHGHRTIWKDLSNEEKWRVWWGVSWRGFAVYILFGIVFLAIAGALGA